MAATVMTFPQDNMDDDDAAVWERLIRGVKAYEPELPPARPAKSPKAKSKQPRRATATQSARPLSEGKQVSKPIDLRLSLIHI